jgi:transposase-like protein
MVAAFVRTIFAQPDEAAARAQLRQVAERLTTSFPKAAEILLAAGDDVLAYLACPGEHWTKIWSTNRRERSRSARTSQPERRQRKVGPTVRESRSHRFASLFRVCNDPHE